MTPTFEQPPEPDDQRGVHTVVRADTPRGEVALRERRDGGAVVHELVVSGVFAMDSLDVSTERRLAQEGLARVSAPRRVLVGGLGLGYTAWSVLADRRVERVDVVELEEDLVMWARLAMTPTLGVLAKHPRARLHIGDVADVLGVGGEPEESLGARPSPTGPWDLVLLDVDNGPSFLVHADNAGLYREQALARTLERLTDDGLLVIWAAQPEPALRRRLDALADDGRASQVDEVALPVTREGRSVDYRLYLARPRR